MNKNAHAIVMCLYVDGICNDHLGIKFCSGVWWVINLEAKLGGRGTHAPNGMC